MASPSQGMPSISTSATPQSRNPNASSTCHALQSLFQPPEQISPMTPLASSPISTQENHRLMNPMHMIPGQSSDGAMAMGRSRPSRARIITSAGNIMSDGDDSRQMPMVATRRHGLVPAPAMIPRSKKARRPRGLNKRRRDAFDSGEPEEDEDDDDDENDDNDDDGDDNMSDGAIEGNGHGQKHAGRYIKPVSNPVLKNRPIAVATPKRPRLVDRSKGLAPGGQQSVSAGSGPMSGGFLPNAATMATPTAAPIPGQMLPPAMARPHGGMGFAGNDYGVNRGPATSSFAVPTQPKPASPPMASTPQYQQQSPSYQHYYQQQQQQQQQQLHLQQQQQQQSQLQNTRYHPNGFNTPSASIGSVLGQFQQTPARAGKGP